MLEPLPRNYLAKKAQELNLERGRDLQKIQRLLDSLWAGQTRVVSLNHAVLKVVTPNASIASELRFGQVKLLGQMRNLSHSPIERLHIQIRSLS